MKKNFFFFVLLISLLILPSISATSVLVDLNTSRTTYGHELLWTANVTGTYDEQAIAVYANDTLFVNSRRDNKTYAVNATNGSIIWEFDVGNSGAGLTGFGGPVYYNGTIYNSFNNVWAINSTTGIQIWNYTSPTAMKFSQGVALDENYLIAISYASNTFVVLNRTTGAYIWNDTIGVGTAAIAAEPLLYGEYLIIATSNSETNEDLAAYNITTGTQLWARDEGTFWDSSPILYNNQIFIGSSAGGPLLLSRYLENGSVVWDTASFNTISTPSVHDDVFFIGKTTTVTTTDLVHSYYLNGTEKWIFYDSGADGTDAIYNQPAISNGMIFFNVICASCDAATGGDGYIYAINETNGNFIWKYHVNEDVFGYTSIAQGNIYVVTDDGNLYAFDFGTGSGDYTLIGHDSNRTGYTADGITDWQNLKVNCSQNSQGNYTCNMTNNYDHNLTNITISFESIGVNHDVYNSSGSLVSTNSINYTFTSTLSSGNMDSFTIVQRGGEISGCATLNLPGEYLLTADVTDSGSTCFTISSSNVTLDCQNHLVDGGNAVLYGVVADTAAGSEYKNLTVKNCKFNDFQYSMYFDFVQDSYFSNITSTSALTTGIYLRQGLDRNLFENFIINSTAHGFHLYYTSNYSNFSNCTVYGNTGNGFYLQSSPDYIRIYNSSIYNNAVNIYIDSTSIGSEIYNNNLTNATTAGVTFNQLGTDSNYFYNNFFNNSLNVKFGSTGADNLFNTTFNSSLRNIVGDLAYGGNFWAKPDGTGYSETCADSNANGVCDLAYDIETNASCIAGSNCTTGNIDYLPLKDLAPVLNTAPTIIANATSPATVYTNTSLLVNLTITDPDLGDTLTGYVRMYVNNTPNTTIQSQTATNNTNTLIATFDSSEYNAGDNITLEVWTGDGTANSTAVNLTNTTVSNSAPNIDFSSLDLMTLEEGNSNSTINLSNYVLDIDDADSLINWTCSDNETNFTSEVNNETKLLNITALNNFYGSVNVTCTAYDSLFLTGVNSFLVNVTNVADVSVVTLISPGNKKGDSDGNVTFSYNVSDSGVNIENCSLILNNILNSTNISITEDTTQNFTLNNLAIGHYNWSINCTNNDSEVYFSSTNNLSVFRFQGFTTNSTNLSDLDVSEISNFVIDNYPYGKINFSENVNLEEGANLDDYIIIGLNSAYVNSSNLTFLNASARITLYDLTFTNPRPLKDGVFCSDCTEVSYTGGTFIFDVISFSNYSSEETPSSSEDVTTTSGGSGLPFNKINLNLTTQELKQKVSKYDTLKLFYENNTYILKILDINKNFVNLSIDSQFFSIGIHENYFFKLNNENEVLKISYDKHNTKFNGNLIFVVVDQENLLDEKIVLGDFSLEQPNQDSNSEDNSPGLFKKIFSKIGEFFKKYYNLCKEYSSEWGIF
ncbi:MAG: PQQ-binding-like beta-propeller repeat protein [Candidatus Pacearchaeota archaeon]|jgi:outer membrane protein assembly factor BamB